MPAPSRPAPTLRPFGTLFGLLALAACEPTFNDEYCLEVETPSAACRAKLGLDNGGAGGEAGSPVAGKAGSSSVAGRSGASGTTSGGKAGASGNGGSSGKSGSAGKSGAGSGGASGSSGAGNGGIAGSGGAGNGGTAGNPSGGSSGAAGAPGCTLPKADCEAITQVVIGLRHVCYLRFEGTVFCWGADTVGQLGSGFAPGLSKTTPKRVDNLDNVSRLAAGADTTCALRKTGEVLCWGADDRGQLGRDQAVTGDTRGVPTAVVGVTGARDLTVGPVHACASDGAGKVSCWGDNGEAQLDKELSLLSRKAVSIGLTAPAAIAPGGLAASATRTCAVQANGSVSCLGNDRFGPGAAVLSTMLAPVQGATSMSAVRGGAYFACGLQPGAGTVACWGRADEGQLGITPAESTNSSAAARAVPSLEGVSSLGTGDAHTCVALSTGEVLCWGDCAQGQCGNGAAVGSVPKLASPTLVPSLTGVEAIYAGANGSCAKLGSGGLGCWGSIAGGASISTPEAITLP